jgi:hypothetical protein
LPNLPGLPFPCLNAVASTSVPVICLADGLALIFHFFALSWHHGSFNLGVRHLILFRDLGSEPQEPEDRVIRAIEYVPILRLLLLAIAVISAIKILASSGLPWTQFFAYCWINPWLLYELLGMLSVFLGVRSLNENYHGPVSRNDELRRNAGLLPQLRDIDLFLYQFSEGFQQTMTLTLFAFVRDSRDISLPNLEITFFSVMGLLLAAFIIATVMSASYNVLTTGFQGDWYVYLVSLSRIDLFRTSFLGVGLFVCFLIFRLNVTYFLVAYFVPFLGIYRNILIVFSALTSFGLSKRHIMFISEDETEFKHMVGDVCNFAAFLIFAVLGLIFYAKVYEPQGTYKPDWLEKLP